MGIEDKILRVTFDVAEETYAGLWMPPSKIDIAALKEEKQRHKITVEQLDKHNKNSTLLGYHPYRRLLVDILFLYQMLTGKRQMVKFERGDYAETTLGNRNLQDLRLFRVHSVIDEWDDPDFLGQIYERIAKEKLVPYIAIINGLFRNRRVVKHLGKGLTYEQDVYYSKKKPKHIITRGKNQWGMPVARGGTTHTYN